MKKVYFDLDGTVADLYNTQGWLDAIQNEQPIFENLKPIVNPLELGKACLSLKIKRNISIRVITWLPMNASKEYEKRCSREKEAWVRKHMPYVDEIVCLSYGVPKETVVEQRKEYSILIDDNQEVGTSWQRSGENREWFDANNDIIEFLKTL